SCDQTGTPLHFHSSTTSGSASLTKARRRLSVLPRQSPSSLILSSISREGDLLFCDPLFVMPGSAFWELGDVSLGRPIPAPPRDGMPPPALHVLEGTGVRVIAARDHLSEMTILGLDDRVSRLALQPMVTRPTQLLACHRLHELTAFFTTCVSLRHRVSLRLVLNESGDVAIEIDEGGHHPATAHFLRRVFDRRTGRGHLGELRFDVVDVPVRDRRRQALRATPGNQPDVLTGDVEADVVGRVGLWLDAEESGVDRLG